VMGDARRSGRWRLPRRLSAWSVMGDVHLDLTSVVCAEPEIELRLTSVMGDVEVLLPDGIEVELTGFDVMGDRELVLAPVPRAPGTPLIRVRAHAVLGDVLVRSAWGTLSRTAGKKSRHDPSELTPPGRRTDVSEHEGSQRERRADRAGRLARAPAGLSEERTP
jgi:Cell wall-active antibiotics response 4TMS YvqF